jgi:hypothetical protein
MRAARFGLGMFAIQWQLGVRRVEYEPAVA